jgi:hypothetical protein
LAIGASRSASLARALASIVLIRRADDVVEHADLVFGKARGAVDEQVGDAGQDFVVAVECARGQRGFELFDQRKGLHHAVERHVFEFAQRMPSKR